MSSNSPLVHNFQDSLQRSHRASDLPIWMEMYRTAFPSMKFATDEREDGEHNRAGIDRQIHMPGGRTIRIDEKIRGRNKRTGNVYEDIALEYVSNTRTNSPGWVCKNLLCDYIAYAIAPIGKGWLLPVVPLQNAWSEHGERWKREFGTIRANNKTYETLSCCVPEKVLFAALGSWHRVVFTPTEW